MLRDSDVLSQLMRRKPGYSLSQDLYCDAGTLFRGGGLSLLPLPR